MKAVTYTSARQHLAKVMARVCHDHEPTVITRNNGKPVVLVSLEDYNAMQKTNYLLHNRQNAQRLFGSITQFETIKK